MCDFKDMVQPCEGNHEIFLMRLSSFVPCVFVVALEVHTCQCVAMLTSLSGPGGWSRRAFMCDFKHVVQPREGNHILHMQDGSTRCMATPARQTKNTVATASGTKVSRHQQPYHFQHKQSQSWHTQPLQETHEGEERTQLQRAASSE